MHRPHSTPLWLFFLASTFWLPHASSADWPQFLGPTRNGVCSETNLAQRWPKEGPPIVWQKKVGQGFSGPVIANRKLILFHRLGNKESVECLDADTGKGLWSYDYATSYRDDFGFDEGPRATPTIAAGKVYTFGAEGALYCLDFATGKKVWNIDAKTMFEAPKGFFGMACSPLVEGPNLLLNIGGQNGAGIVAFDKDSGKVLWKATDDKASYSSPVPATVQGRRYAFFFTRSGLVAIDPKSGKVYFQFPWRPSMDASVSAATPIVVGDLVFLSASYQVGAIVLRVKGDRVEKVWSEDDVLSNHYSTSVHREGFLYGFDGRQEHGQRLRCVELKTGKVRWTQEGLSAGTVTLAGPNLLVLTERGELIAAPASPGGFKPGNRAQILSFGVRAYPAIADGYLYARSKDKLVCVNLKK